MKEKAWNSTPSFFRKHKKLEAAACFVVGLIVLFISLYVLAAEMYFFHNATSFWAVVVEVRHEYVPAGRGSVLAYIPVVEIPNSKDRISVDTYSEENIYSVGARMSVLCDLSVSRRCIRNTFFDTWWGLADLMFALLFLVPSLLYLRRPTHNVEEPLTLNPSAE